MIALIDYSAGNTASVANVLKELKADFILTNDKNEIETADKIILPGVGEASSAMKRLNELRLVSIVKSCKQPFLGICLGMQLLCERTEEGDADCLGIIPAVVKKFDQHNLKVPHMGWNQIKYYNKDNLFTSVDDNSYFYFAHSYFVPQNNYATSVCDKLFRFCSI